MRAAEGLTSVGVKLLGVAVNRLGGDKEDKIYGSGYGYGYGYGYRYGGYGHDADELKPAPAPPDGVAGASEEVDEAGHEPNTVPRRAA